MKSIKFVIIWKSNFKILNPEIWILKSLTLKWQKWQNSIKNHPKSKFLTVEYLRIQFCVDLIFQIFSKYVRSAWTYGHRNVKFWSPYIIKISPNWLKLISNHQNFQENSSNFFDFHRFSLKSNATDRRTIFWARKNWRDDSGPCGAQIPAPKLPLP